uniref:Uncharacterized protein n=1 Tax=Arundo donax TaxID=35708 RepID=A0A0A9B4Q2_ARUDO
MKINIGSRVFVV